MFACCQYCYVKFRNEDGSVNREVLRAWAISSISKKYTDKKQSPLFSEIEELMQKCIDGACNCCCHTIGSKVLH